jgi:hypothetical protein
MMGPNGQELTIDVARLGSVRAPSQLVITEPASERVRMLRADLHDCFVPVSSHWREATTEQAISITQQAVEGLASWPLSVAA